MTQYGNTFQNRRGWKRKTSENDEVTDWVQVATAGSRFLFRNPFNFCFFVLLPENREDFVESEPKSHILTASMLLTIRSRARLEPRHPLVVSIVALRS